MGYLTNLTTNTLYELQLLNEELATESSNSRIIKLEYLKNNKIKDLKTTYNLLEHNLNSFSKINNQDETQNI